MECSLFDKVALEHVKMLQGHAIRVHQTSLASKCNVGFLQELDASAVPRIYKQGSAVIEEGATGDANELYVIAHGVVEVRRSLGGDISQYVPVATLHQGDWFGEVAALGIRESRTATVVCSTICDLRVITRESIYKALSFFPDQGVHLENLAEQRGYTQSSREADTHKLIADLPFFSEFSEGFLVKMAVGMTSLAAFTQQHIIDQDQEHKAMFILLRGKVSLLIEEALLYELKAPALFGEGALIDVGSKSLFTVRSQGLCHFRLITTAGAKDALETFPDDMSRLQELASKNLENVRNVILKRFHGQKLSVLARRQSIGSSHSEGSDEDETVAGWWSGTLFKDSDPRFLQHLSK